MVDDVVLGIGVVVIGVVVIGVVVLGVVVVVVVVVEDVVGSALVELVISLVLAVVVLLVLRQPNIASVITVTATKIRFRVFIMFRSSFLHVVVPFVAVPLGRVPLVPVLPEPDELPVDDDSVAIVVVAVDVVDVEGVSGEPVWIVSVEPRCSS